MRNQSLTYKTFIALISVPIIAALAATPMQAAPVKQTILNQATTNPNSALSEALYQDFLFTTKNMPLQVGDTFPKHTFKTPDGEDFTITGKRTLLFVRGSMCGSCDLIYDLYKEKLLKSNVSIVSAITSVGSGGIPKLVYGRTADATLLTSLNILTSGNLKEVIRHPFGVGTFLIDENNKLRYLSYGFNSKDENLNIAIQKIGQKVEFLTGVINFKKSLNSIKWKNNQLKLLTKNLKNFKTSLVITSETSCGTCDNLLTELKPFLIMLSKKKYGVFYISNIEIKLKIPGITFIYDESKEWMKKFNTNLFPSSFILKSDKYFGIMRYYASGIDQNKLSDKEYRDALLKALIFAQR